MNPKLYFCIVLYVMCVGCTPSPPTKKEVDTPILGKHILLETITNGKRLLIRGDKMSAPQALSTFRIEKNVSIELESLGTVRCDKIVVLNAGKTVRCDGNVHAQIKLPPKTKPTDD